MALLAMAALVGLHRDRDPATLNNVAFAATHLVMLSVGVRPALRRPAVAVTSEQVAADAA